MNRVRNVIIGTVIIVILIMVVGYSAFATQLTLNGTAEISGIWDVRIVDVQAQNSSETCDEGEPQFTNNSVIFNAKMKTPGDTITYIITIENRGNIDAILNNVIFKEDDVNGSPAISYEITELANVLSAGEKTNFSVKVKYDKNTTELPSVKTKTITGIVEYVQK